MEEPLDPKRKQATRKILILAIAFIIIAVLMLTVAVVVILTNKDKKEPIEPLVGSQNGNHLKETSTRPGNPSSTISPNILIKPSSSFSESPTSQYIKTGHHSFEVQYSPSDVNIQSSHIEVSLVSSTPASYHSEYISEHTSSLPVDSSTKTTSLPSPISSFIDNLKPTQAITSVLDTVLIPEIQTASIPSTNSSLGMSIDASLQSSISISVSPSQTSDRFMSVSTIDLELSAYTSDLELILSASSPYLPLQSVYVDVTSPIAYIYKTFISEMLVSAHDIISDVSTHSMEVSYIDNTINHDLMNSFLETVEIESSSSTVELESMFSTPQLQSESLLMSIACESSIHLDTPSIVPSVAVSHTEILHTSVTSSSIDIPSIAEATSLVDTVLSSMLSNITYFTTSPVDPVTTGNPSTGLDTTPQVLSPTHNTASSSVPNINQFSTSPIITSAPTTTTTHQNSVSIISEGSLYTTPSTENTGSTSNSSPYTTPYVTSSGIHTTESPCNSAEFSCLDGMCINIRKKCDGYIHCADGSDEAQDCVCDLHYQFQCNSGQCIDKSKRCDRFQHCKDKSDEVNCSNCIGTQCKSGLCLWTWSARCNNKVECADLSDEQNCPFQIGYRQCKNGMWILNSKWCNGVDDCYDNSDEKSCECERTEVRCANEGKCIHKDWLCDGFVDCINGTDEHICSNCTSDQFVCHDNTCVSMETVCDGKLDCTDGSDEQQCFKLQGDGAVYGKSNNTMMPVCSDGWSPLHSDALCAYLGYSGVNRTSFPTLTNSTKAQTMLKIKEDQGMERAAFTAFFKQISNCSTQSIVSLSCQTEDCGKRSDFATSYIAGGQLSTLGKWPWVVSLSYLGQPFCAGAIISDSWIVTAGHCVAIGGNHNYTTTPYYITVSIGTLKRDGSRGSSFAQTIKADEIIQHPQFHWTGLGSILYDVALVKLQTKIKFSELVRPICLFEYLDAKNHVNCFLAGWGFLNNEQTITPVSLRDVKLNVLSDELCAADVLPLEDSVNVNITLCARYQQAVLSGCQGDSGGPLMCEVKGQWRLAGVMSSGAANCGVMTSRTDRFTRMSGVSQWIERIISVD